MSISQILLSIQYYVSKKQKLKNDFVLLYYFKKNCIIHCVFILTSFGKSFAFLTSI